MAEAPENNLKDTSSENIFVEASADVSYILDEYKNLSFISEVTMWLTQHSDIHPTHQENAMENEEVDTEDEKEPEMKSKEELEFVISRLTTRVLIENYSKEHIKVSCASLNIAPHMQQRETIGQAMQRLEDVSFNEAVAALGSEVKGTLEQISLMKKEDLEM